MNTSQRNPLGDPDDRSSSEIKQDIDQTRGAMDETLEKLGDRLNPRNLLDEVIELFRSPSAKGTAKQVGSSASDFAQTLGRQVRDNPVPTLLVGAGLALLAFGGGSDDELEDDDDMPHRQRGRNRGGRSLPRGNVDEYYTDDELALDLDSDFDAEHDHRGQLYVPELMNEGNDSPGAWQKAKDGVTSAASSIGGTAGSAAGAVGNAANATAGSISDAASATTGAISDAASATADATKNAASAVGSAFSSAGSSTSDAARAARLRSRAAARSASRGTRRAGRSIARGTHNASEQVLAAYEAGSQKFREAHDSYPLGVGIGFLALGALAGLAIPRTRREDDLMGDQSDHLMDQAWQAGEQAVERGQEIASETLDSAKQSAEERGIGDGSLADRAARVVQKTASTIADAAKEEGLHPSQLADDAKKIAADTKKTAVAEAESVKKDLKAKADEVDPDAKKALSKKS